MKILYACTSAQIAHKFDARFAQVLWILVGTQIGKQSLDALRLGDHKIGVSAQMETVFAIDFVQLLLQILCRHLALKPICKLCEYRRCADSVLI